MVSIFLSLFLFLQATLDTPFDVRARDSLILGKGAESEATYYDVPITRQPPSGVLVKLPYTRKGGKFTFDMHHRIALTPDFTSAEVTTTIEVITGGTVSMGTYTMSDSIRPGEKFEENIQKTTEAALDKYVTPLGTKTITLDIHPGPQSISIVGQSVLITRGKNITRIDTPNARIATVSNFKFEEVTETNPLKRTPPN
jgi:hypothetical protein